MVEFAEDYRGGVAMTALPAVKKEVLKLPRAYIANVIYTMVGKDFENWAAARI